jgi:uncharacterized protein YajQ (UPF0234 family)
MEDTIISARIDKKLYKAVTNFCKDEGIKVKSFIQDALHCELVLRDKGKEYVPKSNITKKSNGRIK